MKLPKYAPLLMLLLSACASKPPVSPPVQVQCPVPPPLARLPLGESFLTEAERILFGSQNEPTSSAPASPRVTAGPTR